MALSARTCFGPNRVPDRHDVPMSIGTPKTATSNPSALSAPGNRMNVFGPENRARSFPETGWFLPLIPDTRPQQTNQLGRDMGTGDRGDSSGVKRRRNLDDVPTAHIDAGQAPQECCSLRTG